MRDPRQRGEGKVGFIIALILVSMVIYTSLKFVPVYVAAYDLRDTLRREVQAAALKTNDQIENTILDKAKELKLPINKENVDTSRTKTKFTLRVHFKVPIDLALFVYTFRFDESETGPLF